MSIILIVIVKACILMEKRRHESTLNCFKYHLLTHALDRQTKLALSCRCHLVVPDAHVLAGSLRRQGEGGGRRESLGETCGRDKFSLFTAPQRKSQGRASPVST